LRKHKALLWTGVISHWTGKRHGIIENFRPAYEMLLNRDNCAWWSYVDRFGILDVTWFSSMNLLPVTYVILQVVPGCMELSCVAMCEQLKRNSVAVWEKGVQEVLCVDIPRNAASVVFLVL
jgi:hypothetical protein